MSGRSRRWATGRRHRKQSCRSNRGMEIWKTLRVSHIPTPPTTTDKCLTGRYTNTPLGTKDRSGHRGKRVAVVPASGSALYYAEDLLGSSRVIVQSNGTLCYDADFTPFGAEVGYTSTCPQNYKFEGKERDMETQND